MDNTNTLTKLKAQIEEIEKRIKAISLQVTTSTQVNAIKLCLDDLKELLDLYQAEYENLITDYDTHKDDYQNLLSDYNEHKSNYETFYNDYLQHKTDYNILLSSYNGLTQTNLLEHTTMKDGISRALSQISDLDTEQTKINQRMDYLEATYGDGSSTQTNITETVNTFDRAYMYGYFKIASSCNTPSVYFTCNPSQQIKISVRLKGHTFQDMLTPTIYIKIDGKTIDYEVFTDKTATFDYQTHVYYVPNKAFNRLTIQSNISLNYYYSNCEIVLEGRNVKFLNPDQQLNIFCFNDKYYVSAKTMDNYYMYGTLEKDNLKISDAYLTKIPISKFTFENSYFWLVPALEEGTTYQIKEDFAYGYAFPYLIGRNPENAGVAKVLEDYTPTQYLSWSYSVYSKDYLVAGCGNGGICCCIVVNDGTVRLVGFGVENSEAFTYNGEKLVDEWFRVCVVKNNNLKIGDPVEQYHGAVLTKKDATNVFFPDVHSTYCIDLGVGYNATAYLQPDETINIYINKDCDICKYILEKNEEGIYELSPVKVLYKGMTKYEELYDGKALVWRGCKYEFLEPEA